MPWTFDKAMDIGGRREQQDRVTVLSSPRDDRHLLVVADGMGGHSHGGEAAQIVLDTAERHFPQAPVARPRDFLQSLCLSAHEAINRLHAGHGRSPGSTCVLLYLQGREAHWVHLGDSRLYHTRNGNTLSTTVDHSVLELMLAEGQIDDRDSADLSLRNQIYRRLGGDCDPQPDYGCALVESGDLFWLCSDGFWDTVKSDEVLDAMRGRAAPAGRASGLSSLARERGGARGDNISLILAQWGRRPRRFSPRLLSTFKRRCA